MQRVVEPKYLSRTSLRDEDGNPRVSDEELQAVTNCTLSNALRQLASLVLLAEDIFSELTGQLHGITERSKVAHAKIEKISEIVEKYDPKKVPVRKYYTKLHACYYFVFIGNIKQTLKKSYKLVYIFQISI